MKVIWVGKKAELASAKHFNGSKTKEEMTLLALKVIKNATHTGFSDRANKGHEVARIIWGTVDGVLYGMVIDGLKVKKNIVEIVSFYDVHNAEVKAERFGMKKVK